MNKRVAALGVVAGLAGGSLVGLTLTNPGLVGAQDSTTTTAPDSRPDRSARLTGILRPLVEAGTITQAQADAVIQALQAAQPLGRVRHHGAGVRLEVAANALGMSDGELRQALAGGQTLAQLARARGVDRQVVVDALVAAARASMTERVASGELTQAEADEKLAEITERVTAMVEGRWVGGHRGPGLRPEAPDGDSAPSDSSTSTTAGAS